MKVGLIGEEVKTQSYACLEPMQVIAHNFLCTVHISGLLLHLHHKGTLLRGEVQSIRAHLLYELESPVLDP